VITETAFIGCDNLPQEMAVRLDKGWTFVGEIKTNSLYHNCVCVKCSRRPISYRARVERLEFRMEVVSLRSYLFLTDDMIEVKVVFRCLRDVRFGLLGAKWTAIPSSQVWYFVGLIAHGN